MSHKIGQPLSRRRFLGGTTMAMAGALIGAPRPAYAKGPFLGNQPPAFYRFRLGDFECTVISDGPLPMGRAAKTFLGTSSDDLDRMLTDNFLSTTESHLEQNCLIVNTGGKLVLFDSGMGFSKLFGPDTGRLPASMAAAGIDPRDIDAVCLTHGHIDHLGGLVDREGKCNFPNAQIFISEIDFQDWTDEKRLTAQAPGFMKDFIAAGRQNLLPERDRLFFLKDGDEVVSGVHAIAAPGHTRGHTVYMLSSQGKSLCNTGDLLHHQIILMEQPKLKTIFDTDQEMAGDTRLRILTMLAENRVPLLGYHFPWPGYGHAVKSGDGFRYLPEGIDLSKVG